MSIRDKQEGEAPPEEPSQGLGHGDGLAKACLPDEILRLVDEQIAGAQAAWPGVRVPRDEFLSHLNACLDHDQPLALDGLELRDIYLACACLAGNEPGIAVLHEVTQEVARAALAGSGLAPGVADEVRQEYGIRLLLGSQSTAPLLKRYRGQAPLRSWLRLMMVRRAVQMKKREQRNQPYEEEVMEGLALDRADPELSFLKAHYVEEFRAAFKAALLELDAKDRNILRYLVVEGMKVREIAEFFGLNRVTISKQLRLIRQRLLKRTRHGLTLKLRTKPDELASIMRLIQSRLEITVGCLAEPPDEPS